MNILRKLVVVAVLLLPMAANADLIAGLCNGDTSDQSVLCDTTTGLEWLGLDLLIDDNAQWFYGWEVTLLEADDWRVPDNNDLGSIICFVDPTRCGMDLDYPILDYEQEMQTSAESSAIEKCYPADSPECEVTQLLVRGVQTASVPEPGTLALFGIGLAGVALTRRKRKI